LGEGSGASQESSGIVLSSGEPQAPFSHFVKSGSEFRPPSKQSRASLWTLVCPDLEAVADNHDAYLTMQLKIEVVFEHYAAQSEYYKQANISFVGGTTPITV
jgi:hypothetical protein